MFVQKIKKTYDSNIESAEKYYGVLSILNNLHLTEREIQLMAFIAVRGTISSVSSRDEFCTRYSSSVPTINNMTSKLKKGRLLIKDNNKIKINPAILPNFNEDLGLVISILHGDK